MTHRLVLAAIATLTSLSATLAWADDPPAPPPPQHEWIGKGQFGFLESKGNSDAESINGSIDMSRYDDSWKNGFYVGGLYGRSSGITSAQRIEAREQTDYNFTPRLFAFGGLRYENDKFDGFQYQASITGGVGYKFLDLQDDQLTAQVGAGYRRLRPETIEKDSSGYVYQRTPLDATSEAIGTVTIDYLHKFTPTTTLSNKLLLEYGSNNTFLNDQIALAVKMTTRLSLAVGYGIFRNSAPPAPLKKVDTVSTVNLVFSF